MARSPASSRLGHRRRGSPCLELHDLWVSKAVAGRPKDVEFCRAFVREGFVAPDTLRDRLANTDDLSAAVNERVGALIASSSES